MKTIYTIILTIFAIGCIYLFINTDDKSTEKLQAVSEVITEKTETAAVNIAGKSDVILKIAENRIDTLRKRLIAIKSTKLTLKRKMKNPKLSTKTKDNYTKLMNSLIACEKKGENALLSNKTKLDELKTKLEILETEISISKTSANILGQTSSLNPNDEIRKMVESIEKDLDNANAELEVAILEAR